MSIRVAVVDDQALVRGGLAMVLGHQDDIEVVAEAGTGLEAIEAARTLRPDVILMDIRMPGMTGIDAFSRIKEILPDCVVVLMTGHAVQSLVDEAWEQGAREILQKPVIIDRLLEIVDEVVPRSIAS